MNNVSNFYDNLDLKYPEIGIAMQDIDRLNPGVVKFVVPILTPNLNTSELVDTVSRQNSRNLMNAEKNMDIRNIRLSNYISIPVPAELCTITATEYKIVSGSITMTSENSNISKAHQIGTGEIHIPTNNASASIDVTGRIYGSLTINDSNISKGKISIVPSDEDRYIEKGSKWIIVFVGGDITKPRVISRYLDDEE